MANKDVLMAHRYAEEAKIAAATAKIYSQDNETYSEAAAASATEASGYASSAESYSSLAEQYYSASLNSVKWFVGAYSTAPTTRSDGSALQTGDMYKNTTDDELYSYNSDGTWTSFSYDVVASREYYDNTVSVYQNANDVYSSAVDVYEATGVISEKFNGNSGFGYIGQCSDYDELRTMSPNFSGEQLLVRSAISGWSSSSDSYARQPLKFVALSWMTISDFPDDGGTLISAADGTSVWLNAEMLTGNQIKVEWFGASNDYLTDATTVIQSAFTAANFWANYAYGSTRGPLGHRWEIVFPQKWIASSTITVNPINAIINLNNGTGLFLSSGTYTEHPLDSSYEMMFYLHSDTTTAGSDLFIPAYNSYVMAHSGTLLYGDVSGDQPDSGSIYNTLPTNNVIFLANHGANQTLYTALGAFRDLAFSGAGYAYMNGDYAWGVAWYNCKYINNGYMCNMISALDNGERMDFFGCFAANNGRGINFNTWGGQTNWFGGSLDYFRSEKPFRWSSGSDAKFIIDGIHFEFNPYATSTMFDIYDASETAEISLNHAKIVLAVPSDGGGIVDAPFISHQYTTQAQINDISITDSSASATYTQNYLIYDNYDIAGRFSNINPITLKDYFISAPFVNRKGTSKWQYFYSGQDDYTVTVTADSFTVVGGSSLTQAAKYMYIYIPCSLLNPSARFIMSMITCNQIDVETAFAAYYGYSSQFGGGLVTSTDTSSIITSVGSIGDEGWNGLEVGRNTPQTSYGSFSNANYTDVSFSEPPEGFFLTLNMYNFVEGSTMVLGSATGLIIL